MSVSAGPMASPLTMRYQITHQYFIFPSLSHAAEDGHVWSFVSVWLQEGRLYWCDARTDKIERINLETGENREMVLASNNMDMFSVSVFESYIYWSDRSAGRNFEPHFWRMLWSLCIFNDVREFAVIQDAC